jgi:multicomponent Na+:H+ antiporter subunit D
MMPEWAHPAGPYLAGAVLLLAGPRWLRVPVVLTLPAAGLALAWALADGASARATVMGLPLVWLRVDALGRVFAVIFALFGGLAALYGVGVGSRRLLASTFVAAAAALGIVLAGDWITLYAAWEALALASFVVILDGRTGRASAAAFRYLLVHLGGGALLLAGIAWRGDALVGSPGPGGPGLLILLGLAVNAAVPPLHGWLPDAYPEAAPAGSVVLSAFATKAAVCVLARVGAGEEILVWAGVAMALYGVLFAMLENDLRRLLGYHIVSQVGYMVTGIGLGTPLGLSGAAAHAFCHILYKGLLFMGAGAVVHATGRRTLAALGGLGRAMPATLVLYMIGALSISGAPLLNGFVSKSMIVAAAEAAERPAVALLLMLASVGTFLSVGLKLPWFTFAGADRGIRVAPVPGTMLAAMTVTAGLCVFTGLVPGPLYGLLPHPVTWEPYSAAHVMEALQGLAGTAVAFALLRQKLAGKATVTLDVDRLYRAAGHLVERALARPVARSADALEDAALALVTLALPPRLPSLTGPVGYALLVAVVTLGLGLALLGVYPR